jgi:hypothetical protein
MKSGRASSGYPTPDITEHSFAMNQFLLTGDEPFLFHTGERELLPLVLAAIGRIMPLEELRCRVPGWAAQEKPR